MNWIKFEKVYYLKNYQETMSTVDKYYYRNNLMYPPYIQTLFCTKCGNYCEGEYNKYLTCVCEDNSSRYMDYILQNILIKYNDIHGICKYTLLNEIKKVAKVFPNRPKFCKRKLAF